MREELRRAVEERDTALLALAKAREVASAVLATRVAPNYGPKPIRYRAIDAVNDGLKKALPLPQAGVRAAVQWLLRRKDPR
jgi:hypothetical protein